MPASQPNNARFARNKREKASRLRWPGLCAWVAALIIATLLGGCSSTAPQPSVSQTSTSPQKPPRSTSRTAMSDLFISDDDSSTADAELVSTDSVWQRLREDLQLDRHQQSAAIDRELDWFRKHPAYWYKVTERSNRFLHYVVTAVEQRNMPGELALLPFIESGYDPFALSRSGASGLWQFIPGTGRNFGLQQTQFFDGRRDVMASTDAALNYLQKLHDKFDGDWLLAISAYNFGEGNIQKAIDANRRQGKPTDFWSLSLRDETRTYVPRLLALARIVENPHRYGMTLHHIPDRAYFASVDTYGPIDLKRAADLADVSLDEMRKLNPGLRRLATDPRGPHRILVPADKVDRFSQRLAQTPPAQRISGQKYQDYRVVKGDTLLSISRKFNVEADSIRSTNRLDGNNVSQGQLLLIPGGYPSGAPARFEALTTAATTTSTYPSEYRVAKGDTLWGIAKRYGVKPADILRWNGLSANASLRPGQRLHIASTSSKPAIANAAKINAAKANSTTPAPGNGDQQGGLQDNQQKVGYTVKNGDSLYAIANKFNVNVEDILRWNQVNPNSLRPGTKLTLYVD